MVWSNPLDAITRTTKKLKTMKTILIIDIETTNFLDAKGKIVEIGIVELNLEFGEKNIIFDEVTHEKGITKYEVEHSWIIKNSDLTVKEIQHSTRLDILQPKIQELIDRYPLGATAYNNKFDFDFLESRGFTFPKKLMCPMLLSTNICKLPGKKGGYKWPKVEEVHEHFFGDVGYVEAHRGADDAFHEADIVLELYKRGVFKI